MDFIFYRRLAYYRSAELVVVVIIIGFLALLILNRFGQIIEYVKMTETISFLGLPGINVMEHYARYGEWPQDNREVGGDFQNATVGDTSSIKEMQISDGAIHFILGGKQTGKIVTFHPAILEGNPSGPIIWVAGNNNDRPDWVVIGEDKTNIDNRTIPKVIR